MSTVALNPEHFGLPSREQLEAYDIWDSYFTPPSRDPDGARLIAAIDRVIPVLDKAAIRRCCLFLDVGLGAADAATERRLAENPDDIAAPLRRWPERLLGVIKLNAEDVDGSLAAIDRWIARGPMVGVYFSGGGRGALPCNHPNCRPLVERVGEVGGLIMQHTWFKTGGKDDPGGSTPSELAEVAARYPAIRFVCAHAGGEWEKGIRAIRGLPNVSVETSGFDPTAGFLEMAVRELGSQRIVFGSHLPSRSLGTEFGKIFGAKLSEQDRRRILGENLRDLLRRRLG